VLDEPVEHLRRARGEHLHAEQAALVVVVGERLAFDNLVSRNCV
jgi:hypothetical protein